MKLIVISNPTDFENEEKLVNSLFEAGMEFFHVYKPSFSSEEIQNYIQKISPVHHIKIFIHDEFLKFHSFEELETSNEKYDYAFLSPIFDSISKDGYKSTFDFALLQTKTKILKNKNIIALGGIEENKIEIVAELGFAGIAVVGAIWKSKNPVEKFKQMLKLCNSFSKLKNNYA